MNTVSEDRLASACEASLERSLTRRALARRLRTRRRRTRGGTGAAAGLLAVAALAAPFAVAQRGNGVPAHSALLRKGSEGDLVARVQRKLGVTATGYFGPQTRAAVRRFQRSRSLVVDGIVGPQTLGALGLAAAPAKAAAAPSGDAAGALARIAQCESGGNPTAVSRTGIYRGKYQFSRATWAAMGGSGDPAAAPEAEQDRVAVKLYAQQGSAPWPNCG